MVAKDHWEALKPADRAELARILKASGGRPGNLSPRDRNELREIVRRLDLGRLGRDLAPLASKHRGRRR